MKNSSWPCLYDICFSMEITALLSLSSLGTWRIYQGHVSLASASGWRDYWAFLPWEHEEFIRVVSLWHLLQDVEITDLLSLSSLGTRIYQGLVSVASASGQRLLTNRAFLPWEHKEFFTALFLWHLLQEGVITDIPSLSSLGTWGTHQGLCLCGICFRTERLLTYRAFLSWEHEEFIRALSLWHLLQDED